MQQINLYQATLKKPQEVLSLAQVAMLSVGLIALLGLISAVQWWGDGRQRQRMTEARSEQTQIQTQITALQQLLASRHKAEDEQKLKDELALRDAELQNKQQVLKLLSGRRLGNVDGFSAQLAGLARQHIDGLWLTGLHIQHGGERLRLRGSALQPELLPRYLQKLAGENSFHGVEFKSFVMQRSKDGRQIDFDLHSSEEKSPP